MDLLECSAVKVIGSPIENRRELQQLPPAIGVAALARELADLEPPSLDNSRRREIRAH